MKITVLLADDHPFIRQGTRNLLEAEQIFAVVGEAEDGVQAVDLAERLKPTILVIDLMMPNLNGLEVIKLVKHRTPETRVIVLSMHSADPYVLEAFRVGAEAYILKDSAPGELIHAIRSVLDGLKFLSPNLPPHLSNLVEAGVSKTKDLYDALTVREREVYQLVAEGKTSNEISKMLSISPRTAELHRSRLMGKLNIRNRAELVRDAIKRGILSLDT